MPANLHPLFVHFPIALLLSSVALSWTGRFWPGKGLEQAAWYTLLLGLAGTVVTLISGLVAAQGVPADSPAMATLNIHRALGIATFVIFGALAIWNWRSKGAISGNGRLFFTIIQIVGVALIVAVGFYGGELVYTFGVGVAAAVP
jgi:uncharacterized membrane protein